MVKILILRMCQKWERSFPQLGLGEGDGDMCLGWGCMVIMGNVCNSFTFVSGLLP